ncbi:MAG: hypothetical protein ACFE98_01845 [Candidatus Hermodarchaeota archaeon]
MVFELFKDFRSTTDPMELYQKFNNQKIPSFEKDGLVLFRLFYPEEIRVEDKFELLILVFNTQSEEKKFDIIVQTPMVITYSFLKENDKKDQIKRLRMTTAPSLRHKLVQNKFERLLNPNQGLVEVFSLQPETKLISSKFSRFFSQTTSLSGTYEIIVSIKGKSLSRVFKNPSKPDLRLKGLKSMVQII